MFSQNVFQDDTLTTTLEKIINTFNAEKLNLHMHILFSAGQTESVFVQVNNYDVYTETDGKIIEYELKPTDANSDLTLGINKVIDVTANPIVKVVFINNNNTDVEVTFNVETFPSFPIMQHVGRQVLLNDSDFGQWDYFEIYTGDCEAIIIDFVKEGSDVEFPVKFNGCSDENYDYNDKLYAYIDLKEFDACPIFIPTADKEILELYQRAGETISDLSIVIHKLKLSVQNTKRIEVR